MILDLTQPLDDHTPFFPGDTRFNRQPLPDQHPWQVSTVAMSSHSGTHLDAPLHRIPGALAIDDLRLERLIGSGVVLDATGYPDNTPIPATLLDNLTDTPTPGWFALIRTGWDRYWREERYFRHPYLSPELAERLVAAGCGLVAIDALSVDSTADDGDAAHVALLGQNVLIAENLRGLDQLQPGQPYIVSVLPLRMSGSDGSPIRCIAWDPGAV
ncbi:MAG: cyclase family protein [Thermomicrobiales bacterium]